MNPLRQQMTDAMLLRGMAARTQQLYLAAVAALAKHYRRSPDTLTTDELQAYLLFLITDKKLAYASVNQAFCAFRFLFEPCSSVRTRVSTFPWRKYPSVYRKFSRAKKSRG